MATAVYPTIFQSGARLIGGHTLNASFNKTTYSTQDTITATSGGGKTSAFALFATVSRITVAAAAGDSALLPNAVAGSTMIIINDAANAIQVFGAGTDTINNVATATGVSQAAGTVFSYVCPIAGKWYATSGSATGPAPLVVGSALTLTSANANQPILLNTAAGSTATLPAATGTGNVFKFFVSTTATSNAHKILAASVSDFLNGNAVGHTAAGATLTFSAAAATAHSIQMPFAGTQPSGGFIGDWFEFTDAATNLWMVKGMYQAGTTATTPFSAATT